MFCFVTIVNQGGIGIAWLYLTEVEKEGTGVFDDEGRVAAYCSGWGNRPSLLLVIYAFPSNSYE